MKASSFIFLAQGFEEIEAITVVDILRRAEMPIQIVSITESLQVRGTHGITITADTLFADTDFSDSEWLIFPGGMPGAQNLHKYEPLNNLIKEQNSKGGKIAAICAAPAIVLAPLGVIDGKDATCYPGFEDSMKKVKKSFNPVVVAGNIITASGPSSAMQFGLAIVSMTKGEDEAYDIASGVLLYPQHHQYYF